MYMETLNYFDYYATIKLAVMSNNSFPTKFFVDHVQDIKKIKSYNGPCRPNFVAKLRSMNISSNNEIMVL